MLRYVLATTLKAAAFAADQAQIRLWCAVVRPILYLDEASAGRHLALFSRDLFTKKTGGLGHIVSRRTWRLRQKPSIAHGKTRRSKPAVIFLPAIRGGVIRGRQFRRRQVAGGEDQTSGPARKLLGRAQPMERLLYKV